MICEVHHAKLTDIISLERAVQKRNWSTLHVPCLLTSLRTQGKMSKHIVDLDVGDKLEFKGPIGKVCHCSINFNTGVCSPLTSMRLLWGSVGRLISSYSWLE